MSSVNFLLGKTLGKYEVLEHVGHGGMAEVYKGQHVQLDRMVAVKVLHPFLADEEGFVVRFQREARIVATLRHPNIVQVYDFDFNDELNIYYMVMEYIDGPTLKSILSEGPVPPDQVLRFGASMADAMAYAHKRGMVHRDVKPANIMFTSDNQPVLTDFGIAKMLTLSGLTASGAMVGTPAYMAPEVGMGKAGTSSSDIYSLGVVLYQMLSGRLPYESESPMGMVMQHINDPPPPLSKVAPNVPADFESVVFRALAKQPEERYANAEEMAHALRKLAGIDSPNSMALPTPLPQGDAVSLLGGDEEDASSPTLTTPALTPPVPTAEDFEDERLVRTWPPEDVTPLSTVITPDEEKRRGKKRRKAKREVRAKKRAQREQAGERKRPFLLRAFRTGVLVLVLLIAGGAAWWLFGGYIPPQIATYLPPVDTIDLNNLRLDFLNPPTVDVSTPEPVTVVPPTETPTSTPTQPSETPSPTLTVMPSPTFQSTPTSEVAAVADCNQRLKLNQMLFEPGETIAPMTSFVVYVALRNNGDCTWPEGLALTFVSGEQMGAPDTLPIKAIAPQEGVQVVLPMVAPEELGAYEARWEVRNTRGEPFGSAIFVRVIVSDTVPTPTPPAEQPEPEPTARVPLTLLDPVLTSWKDDVAQGQWSGTLTLQASGGAGNYQYYHSEISELTRIPQNQLAFVWQRCADMPLKIWVLSGEDVVSWEGLIAYPDPDQCQ